MKIEISSLCDIGQKRKVNQDAILVHQDEERGFALFLVADGMGGHANGEIASRAIASGVQGWLLRMEPEDFLGRPTAMLCAVRDEMLRINDYLWKNWNRRQRCGSTCALLLIWNGVFGTFSIGDSRIYLSRKLRCTQITRDDVWENQRDVIASYSESERRQHPNYGKLVHALGSEQTMTYSMQTQTLLHGDVFALCSDGIHKMCDPNWLKRRIVSCHWNALDVVRDSILAEVYANGAKDNVSLILVKYH